LGEKKIRSKKCAKSEGIRSKRFNGIDSGEKEGAKGGALLKPGKVLGPILNLQKGSLGEKKFLLSLRIGSEFRKCRQGGEEVFGRL